jgi:hypothetical protein
MFLVYENFLLYSGVSEVETNPKSGLAIMSGWATTAVSIAVGVVPIALRNIDRRSLPAIMELG